MKGLLFKLDIGHCASHPKSKAVSVSIACVHAPYTLSLIIAHCSGLYANEPAFFAGSLRPECNHHRERPRGRILCTGSCVARRENRSAAPIGRL